jgi:L-alanine-DL-glutamate epimerase-like enolase superfamily enzyme
MTEAVAQIDVWACRVPLPAPLDFGTYSVSSRYYVALRISTRSGLQADVIGHCRGSPVDVAIADILAPRLIGSDALDVDARHKDFLRLAVALEADGVMGRAWSLIELALQGIGASARQLPVWRAIGGSPRRIAVQLVEGYSIPGESDEAFAHRLLARVREGYTALKIAGSQYSDGKVLLRRLHLLRREAPQTRLVIDMGWSWHRADEHREQLAALAELGIDWLEDAFPRDAVDEYARAAQMTTMPVGCGDEATRASDILALVERTALAVARLDVTALGGITGVLPLMRRIVAARRRVSLHEFADLHIHVALAEPQIDHVEMFPTDRPFDARHLLTLSCAHQRVKQGWLEAPLEPGFGIDLDVAQVARFAYRHACVRA